MFALLKTTMMGYLYNKIDDVNDIQTLQDMIDRCEYRIEEIENLERENKLKKCVETISGQFLKIMNIDVARDIRVIAYKYDRKDCNDISCYCRFIIGPFDIIYEYEHKKSETDVMHVEVNDYEISGDQYFVNGLDRIIFDKMCDELKTNIKYTYLDNKTVENFIDILVNEVHSWVEL